MFVAIIQVQELDLPSSYQEKTGKEMEFKNEEILSSNVLYITLRLVKSER